VSAALLRTVDFGDLDADIWGDVWAPAAGGGTALAHVGSCSSAGPATHAAATLLGEGADEAWSLGSTQGANADLTIEPVGAPAPDAGGGFAQLCRVRGVWTVDGRPLQVDCAGCRTARTPADAFDSIRAVSGWFGPEAGFSVVAVRPRRGRGHDRDLIDGAVFEAGEAVVVAEPRLSSTYRANGRPARAGLELWLTAVEDAGEDVDDGSTQFPRRAAGEALGPAAVAAVAEPGLELLTELFRWHLSGNDGAGVYRFVRRR
jgi:hypothetical protein